jgi:hypothetical protein
MKTLSPLSLKPLVSFFVVEGLNCYLPPILTLSADDKSYVSAAFKLWVSKLSYFQKTKPTKTALSWPILLSFLLLCLCSDACYAVPDGIPVVSNTLKTIVAYGPFVFTAGGAYYSAINGRLILNGDYRRLIPGVISVVATSIGLAGVVGERALTVLVP